MTQNVALLAAAAFGVMTALLLMRVAVGNPQTALAVLQQGGTGNVLLGSALSLVPLLIAGLVGGLLAQLWREVPSWSEWRVLAPKLGWSFVGLAAGLLLAPPLLVGIAAVMALWFRRRSDEGPEGMKVLGVTLLAVAWLLFVAKPWWPLERLELSNGDTAVGYVVSGAGSDVGVLVGAPRQVVHLTLAAPDGRSICTDTSASLGRWYSESLWSMMSDPAGYAPCPD